MISKKILIPVVILGIAGAAAIGAAGINAQTSTQSHSGLIDAIAQKFGLDKAKVQSTVEEYHKTRQEQRKKVMQDKIEEKLTAEVKNGKITEVQKQTILKKIAEIKSSVNFESLKNMTPSERMKLLKDKKAELITWAQSQGIDPSYVMFGFGRGGIHKQGWAKP